MTDTKAPKRVACIVEAIPQPWRNAIVSQQEKITAQSARIDALEAALRKYWNGSYFSGVSHEDADFINAALNDKTPTDTGPAGE